MVATRPISWPHPRLWNPATTRRFAVITDSLVAAGRLPPYYDLSVDRLIAEAEFTEELGRIISQLPDRLRTELLDGALRRDADVLRNRLTEIAAELGPDVQDIWQRAQRVLTRLGFDRVAELLNASRGLVLDWSLIEPRASRLIDELSFQASQSTLERMQSDINRILGDGIRAGDSIQEMASTLRDTSTAFERHEAERIIRTEGGWADNNGAVEAMQAAEVDYVQWIATADSRTRPTHIANHALVVQMGEIFPNGLRWPNDRDGPAGALLGEWINCRCAANPYFPTAAQIGAPRPFLGL